MNGLTSSTLTPVKLISKLHLLPTSIPRQSQWSGGDLTMYKGLISLTLSSGALSMSDRWIETGVFLVRSGEG